MRIYDQETTDLVLKIRAELESTGWDAGPKSIWYEGVRYGRFTEPIPSVATIGRILSDAGRVKANPKKRPRSSLIRFVRANAMELWQLDAFEFELTGSTTKITVYQLLDDSTRFDVGTQAFHGVENGNHAITTISDAFANYGVPQEMLTDNGNAFNGNRQGWVVATQLFLADYGCRGISGMPGHPQTQGKNERGHQTLLNVLRAHRPRSLAEARKVIAMFRDRYNYRRRHQSLPGDMNPHQAWQAAIHTPSDGTPIPHAEVEAIARGYAQRRRVLAAMNQPHVDDEKSAGEPLPTAADSVQTVSSSLRAIHRSISMLSDSEYREHWPELINQSSLTTSTPCSTRPLARKWCTSLFRSAPRKRRDDIRCGESSVPECVELRACG
ncbi:integrase core domain-containing protein [Brevibacterium limosum]|uniref:integrase core domain-containing protein n=1 Tax=Brevibacterium limosum TaxID=2697565 RepID=UPI00141F4B23|nr:integrase core domain-containing protein [Brevibacterium limosum]